ncbi:MAG: hypothetical protein HDR15_00985 [Lachnospiraceae bacterium]|nr:hypothetical protein [Lachnospiraceae bacterium]
MPEKYKEWLQHSDGGTASSLNDRPVDSYVVIGSLDTDDPVLFKRESEQISIYSQEAGRIEEDEVYDDFFAFLNELYDLFGMEDYMKSIETKVCDSPSGLQALLK